MTVALVANIARPISSAISTAFAMDNYGKLNDYGKLGAWSPLSLFAASEVGAWYDPSDLSTMFQDSAGTTPVTADGQPVGKILDKSGRGNHASQATAARRPLYKTDGTYHWLQFDGVDDSLSTASIDFTATDKMSVFAGVYKATDASTGMLSEIGPGGGVGSFFLATGDGGQNYSFALSGSVGITGFKATTLAAPIKNVIDCMFDIGGALAVDEVKPKVNGVIPTLSGFGGASTGSNNFGTWSLYVGARAGTSLFLNGNIYSLIVRGALSTTQEITDTETWVNSKTGAY